jgi:hypothetical protein
VVVPLFDHAGNLESFGVTSHMASETASRTRPRTAVCFASRSQR